MRGRLEREVRRRVAVCAEGGDAASAGMVRIVGFAATISFQACAWLLSAMAAASPGMRAAVDPK
jgi:hypothetical protein